MIDTINEIYSKLSTEQMNLSQKKFSKNYLGMSESYLSHILSMKKQSVSAECLLRLYGKLKRERAIYQHQLPRAKSPIQKYKVEEGLALFTLLTQKAHQAIEEYSISQTEN